ncbi:MAG: dipeptide ABC transporter ATP-binding protein [Clostridia bacterium]|nr:dipeptide ABC transporter ATP-binding protein [Clostridia bacterium]
MEKTENGEVLETESAEKAETALPDDVLLQVNDLKKYFPVAKNFFGKPVKFLKAVDGISFTLKKGKTLGIVGESGCGKSTMGRSLLRLYDGVQGEILFEGQDVAKLKNREFDKLRPNMQMIFQDPYASLSPRLTVGEIIGESARQHHLVDKAGFHDYVLKVMDMCGLQPHYFERYPHEFSGGQRQRICIARALALQPKLVVCDEPVSALDVSIQAQVINMLIELREKLGLTYIFISHDLSVVKHISDDVGVMYLGNIVEYGSKESVFSHTLHPYTKALFSAVPVPNPHVKMNRIMLKGDIPSPVNPPKGCKFHTRCEHCMEICSRIAPEYKEVEEGHFCSCHLYNSEEDTLRLLAQADENERNEAIAAEKEANKPWNKAKVKVVTTFNNVVAKIKSKFKKSEDAEQTEEQQAQPVEEVKEVAPDTTDETAVTAAETTAEEQTVAEVKVKVKVPSGKKVPEVKVEVSVPSEQETEEVKAPAKKKTTRSSTPKKDKVEKK